MGSFGNAARPPVTAAARVTGSCGPHCQHWYDEYGRHEDHCYCPRCHGHQGAREGKR